MFPLVSPSVVGPCHSGSSLRAFTRSFPLPWLAAPSHASFESTIISDNSTDHLIWRRPPNPSLSHPLFVFFMALFATGSHLMYMAGHLPTVYLPHLPELRHIVLFPAISSAPGTTSDIAWAFSKRSWMNEWMNAPRELAVQPVYGSWEKWAEKSGEYFWEQGRKNQGRKGSRRLTLKLCALCSGRRVSPLPLQGWPLVCWRAPCSLADPEPGRRFPGKKRKRTQAKPCWSRRKNEAAFNPCLDKEKGFHYLSRGQGSSMRQFRLSGCQHSLWEWHFPNYCLSEQQKPSPGPHIFQLGCGVCSKQCEAPPSTDPEPQVLHFKKKGLGWEQPWKERQKVPPGDRTVRKGKWLQEPGLECEKPAFCPGPSLPVRSQVGFLICPSGN